MGLGNNQDYKTSERAARKTLLRHGHIMADLVLDGMNREEASALAFKMAKDKNLCEQVYAERARHRENMRTILGTSSYGER